ncbi:hypothetical protein L226DRAFT_560997 [Lentinus tigrinus ALCF2SS1-7]|uniref:uncharacterized protein n=1 Tax=Lentinus tigrinus ALCF2SS1-7 TaxID=1328758 RepID=UPI001165FDA7|nr:hypothetical protein L226DRAFT_560997 [Lentinus tigrinus ALCF2SS1-7]
MNGQGFTFHVPRGPLPVMNHAQDVVQLDYGPPDGTVAPPMSQLKNVRIQEWAMAYRQPSPSESEEDGDPSADSKSEYPSSQETQLSDLTEPPEDDASSTTTVGDVGAVDSYRAAPTQAPPPTQQAQWHQFHALTRTRTLRKEDTMMSIDAPSIVDQVEERMVAIEGNLRSELCNRQAQSAAEIQAAIRQCFLQTQRELLDLKKEVVDLRLQLERLGLRNGY